MEQQKPEQEWEGGGEEQEEGQELLDVDEK